MTEQSKATIFENAILRTRDREFPDIIISGYFGVEVKATKKDDWHSIGNSVLESSRFDSVKYIFIFFGKLGGDVDVKYRTYEDCLSGIAVTHFPRYKINMDLVEGNSIFNLMDTPYEEIRTSKKPIKYIREYYKKQLGSGQALWWLDDDVEHATVDSPMIKNFNSIAATDKADIIAELMVIFPEIFSKSTQKYERIPAYLTTKHSIVSSNLRDVFSAGGAIRVTIDGKHHTLPHIAGLLMDTSEKIKTQLATLDPKTISSFWEFEISDNLEKTWVNIIDKYEIPRNDNMRYSHLIHACWSNRVKRVI
jgi:hypothetical protein